jgi:hypothetical protein
MVFSGFSLRAIEPSFCVVKGGVVKDLVVVPERLYFQFHASENIAR